MGFMDKMRGAVHRHHRVARRQPRHDRLAVPAPRQRDQDGRPARRARVAGRRLRQRGRRSPTSSRPARTRSRRRTCRSCRPSRAGSTASSSPFKAEVYFVNTRQFTDLKWGTQNPVIDARRRVRPGAAAGLRRLRRCGSSTRPRLLRRARRHRPAVPHRRGRRSSSGRSSSASSATALGPARACRCSTSPRQPADDRGHPRRSLTARARRARHQRPDASSSRTSRCRPRSRQALDKRTQMGVARRPRRSTPSSRPRTRSRTRPSNPGGGAGEGSASASAWRSASRWPSRSASPAGAGPAPPPRRGRRRCPAQPRPGSWPSAGSRSVRSRVADLPGAGRGRRRSRPTTLVWQQGMAAWTAAPEVPELAGAARRRPAAAAAGDRSGQPAAARRSPEPADRDDRERAGDPRPGTPSPPRCASCGAQIDVRARDHRAALRLVRHRAGDRRPRGGHPGALLRRVAAPAAAAARSPRSGRTCCGAADAARAPRPSTSPAPASSAGAPWSRSTEPDGRGRAGGRACRSTSTGAARRTAFGRWVALALVRARSPQAGRRDRGPERHLRAALDLRRAHRDRLRRPARRALLGDRDLPGAGRQRAAPGPRRGRCSAPAGTPHRARRARLRRRPRRGHPPSRRRAARGDGAVAAGCGPAVPAGVPHRLLRAAVRRRAGRGREGGAQPRMRVGHQGATAATTSAATSSGSPTSTSTYSAGDVQARAAARCGSRRTSTAARPSRCMVNAEHRRGRRGRAPTACRRSPRPSWPPSWWSGPWSAAVMAARGTG